jgi:hypothetical protein
MSDPVYIAMQSHRTRAKVHAKIGHVLHYMYSLRRSTTGGYARITREEYEKVKQIGGVSQLRKPYDDLYNCF